MYIRQHEVSSECKPRFSFDYIAFRVALILEGNGEWDGKVSFVRVVCCPMDGATCIEFVQLDVYGFHPKGSIRIQAGGRFVLRR